MKAACISRIGKAALSSMLAIALAGMGAPVALADETLAAGSIAGQEASRAHQQAVSEKAEGASPDGEFDNDLFVTGKFMVVSTKAGEAEKGAELIAKELEGSIDSSNAKEQLGLQTASAEDEEPHATAEEQAAVTTEALIAECDVDEINETASVVDFEPTNADEATNGADRENTTSNVIEQASRIAESLPQDVHVVPVKKYKPAYVKSNYSKYKSSYANECPSEQGETFGFVDNNAEPVSDHCGGASTVKPYQMAEKTGRTATVAVIDSGFRTTHKLLEGKLLTEYAYNSNTDELGAKHIADKLSHGTAVASVIASNENFALYGDPNEYKTGVCANTKILPIKAIDDSKGEFNDVAILRALAYVEKLVSSGTVKNLHVINMSLGAHYSAEEWRDCRMGDSEYDPVYAQIRKLHDKYGIMCVCAAGNEGFYHGFSEYEEVNAYDYPADYDCCMSVMASQYFDLNAYFTCAGPEKDISAPGVGIIGASAATDTAIENELEGTSFASPIIAGALSTMIQIDPELSVDDAKRLLEKTATPFTVIGKSGDCPPKNNGAGMANVEKAVWEDMKARGKVDTYWNGMSDGKRINGILYGFRVTSAKNRTVAVTALGPSSKALPQITFPTNVTLGDGVKYKVTNVAISCFTNWLHEKTSTPVVLHSGISSFNNYEPNMDILDKKISFVIRSSKLSRKNVQCGCLSDIYLGTVTVDVSKQHKRNLASLKTYKGLFDVCYGDAQNNGVFKTSTKTKGIGGASVKLRSGKARKYTGKSLRPGIKVTMGRVTLKLNVDYKVSYKNNVKRGKAKVMIRGIGNYSGQKTLYFDIK